MKFQAAQYIAILWSCVIFLGNMISTLAVLGFSYKKAKLYFLSQYVCDCCQLHITMIVIVQKDLFEFALDPTNHVDGVALTCPRKLDLRKGMFKQLVTHFGHRTANRLKNQKLDCGKVAKADHPTGVTCFGLVVKESFKDKASLDVFRECLDELKIECHFKEIKHLAIPRLGCGADQLQWFKTEKIILEMLDDILPGMDITICVK